MATDKHDTGPAGNDILLTLAGINRGRLASEASDKLSKLVAAVTQYEKKGTLTIKVEVNPGAEDGTVNLKAMVSAAAPQPEHPAVFFVNGDTGELSRDDPTMEPMFGRDEIPNGGHR